MATAQNSSPAPTSRTLDWASFVRAAWGEEFNQPDTAYRFSNGREFKGTENVGGGIYDT